MTDDPLSLSLDDGTVVWSIVEQQLDAFCQAWDETEHPPAMQDFVGDQDGVVRRLILMDLIKVDIEFRMPNPDWEQPMEFYLDAWPELAPDKVVPAELLYEDVFHRRSNGLEVDLKDYRKRFPESIEALNRLLGTSENSLASTGLSQGPSSLTAYRVGDVVDDFELKVELGKGAFGVVFLAFQESMQRTVALKISANRGTEAQVLAQLEHPNIVGVYDRRVLPSSDIQLFYMQYVRGGTLQDALKHVQTQTRDQWNGKLVLDAIDSALKSHGEVIPAPTPARLALSQSNWLTTTPAPW